jgi:hypothetical protein
MIERDERLMIMRPRGSEKRGNNREQVPWCVCLCVGIGVSDASMLTKGWGMR